MFFFLSMCIKIGIAEVIPVKEVIFHLENDIQNFFTKQTDASLFYPLQRFTPDVEAGMIVLRL